jgi:alcohol dehydrogenase (NADP+)
MKVHHDPTARVGGVAAYAAPSASTPLTRTTIERRAVGPRDVLIDIAFAGICHSDIHTARGEWGEITYPQVVGHEIAGTVREVGSEVASHRIGDRVGVGVLVNSCRICDACRAGLEQHCEKGNVGTYGDIDLDGTITQGGYSQRIVVDEHFVLRIPESIPLDAAAPLLCAGITLWSPLRRHGVGPGTRVAILGLGGLGHIGVKLAVALGAEVTVLSQSLAKRNDGIAMGATAFYATSDPATFSHLDREFDVILNTVSAPLDLDAYLGLLRLGGTLVMIGVPPEPQAFLVSSLMDARRTITGSMIGGISETQEMLDFCAEQAITPDIELLDAARINEAWDRVLRSDVRYRFVIDAATI